MNSGSAVAFHRLGHMIMVVSNSPNITNYARRSAITLKADDLFGSGCQFRVFSDPVAFHSVMTGVDMVS